MLQMHVGCRGFFKTTDIFIKNNQCLDYVRSLPSMQATASVVEFLEVSDSV